MQNTRQAIITIESSMIYSLLSKSYIWHYQITLQGKQKHKQIHVDTNDNSSSAGINNHKDHCFKQKVNTTVQTKIQATLDEFQCFGIQNPMEGNT